MDFQNTWRRGSGPTKIWTPASKCVEKLEQQSRAIFVRAKSNFLKVLIVRFLFFRKLGGLYDDRNQRMIFIYIRKSSDIRPTWIPYDGQYQCRPYAWFYREFVNRERMWFTVPSTLFKQPWVAFKRDTKMKVRYHPWKDGLEISVILPVVVARWTHLGWASGRPSPIDAHMGDPSVVVF